jgi:choline dehydrogenase
MPALDQKESMSEHTNHAVRVGANQKRQFANLKSAFDFIVCGSGSSGSVVARRLAEIPGATVLLIEAGGSDDVPEVEDAARWSENLGSGRDWAFQTRSNPHLNGRSLVCSMGKVLGGGSSINLMVWSRGHCNDWNGFAKAAGDPSWGYDSILKIYQRIEDWRGVGVSKHRGTGGEVFVQPSPNPNPLAPAFLQAASELGIPTFADQNGEMMESAQGVALSDFRIRDGKRQSVFRSYVYPWMDRPNLTVLANTLVTRLRFDGASVIGVEVLREGRVERFHAESEVVLSLGAIQTPKVLMQSGIGSAEHLKSFNIEVIQHLPGVGANLQEHVLLRGCIWEYESSHQFRGSGPEATFFAKSDASLATPDLQALILDRPVLSPTLGAQASTGPAWTITPALVRPQSRGTVRLTGAAPSDPVDIDANLLSERADVTAAMAGVRLCRKIGNSSPFASLRRRVFPGPVGDVELEAFVREAVVPYWHHTCTAKMGHDEMSVVDGELRVYGIDKLRIADGSIMPFITTGNTMAPCVIIGERAGELMRSKYKA